MLIKNTIYFLWLWLLTQFPLFGQTIFEIAKNADYIFISPQENISSVEKLARLHNTINSFSTCIIPIDSIYNKYSSMNNKVGKDTCLKNFIKDATLAWQKSKPKFILLAGNINTIPSHIEIDSVIAYALDKRLDTLMIDQWLVEGEKVSGNRRELIANIGRLPAWDSESLRIMIEKIVSYNHDYDDRSWFNKMINIADSRDYELFEMDEKIIQTTFSSVWKDITTAHIRKDSPQYLSKTAFLNSWSNGVSIVTYTGHGAPMQLSNEGYLTTSDINNLTNGNRLPLCLFGGCSLTFDKHNPVTLAVRLIEKQNGGAVAVISSAGENYEYYATEYINKIGSIIVGNPSISIGKSFTEAKNVLGSDDNCIRRFNLLGDPALIIKHQGIAAIPYQEKFPTSFSLSQNYPNPFNPSTVISYKVQAASHVTLKVYDLLGREVATLVNENKPPGNYEVQFSVEKLHGTSLPSGVYFYRLQAGDFIQTKKMQLLK